MKNVLYVEKYPEFLSDLHVKHFICHFAHVLLLCSKTQIRLT